MGIGIMQGSVRSPILCNVLVNELPTKLVESISWQCLSVGGVQIPIIMQCDDQTLFLTIRV
jgi:hypothetical protein